MDKQTQFIDWLCGKDVKFPFFQRMPKVAMPIGWRKDEEVRSCDEKYGSHLNLGDDVFSHEEED